MSYNPYMCIIWSLRSDHCFYIALFSALEHSHCVRMWFYITCHLHFWQNDRDLLRATAVTRGGTDTENKSQHRKLTLQKKILPPLLQLFELATFHLRVRRSNHWAIPLPEVFYLSLSSMFFHFSFPSLMNFFVHHRRMSSNVPCMYLCHKDVLKKKSNNKTGL